MVTVSTHTPRIALVWYERAGCGKDKKKIIFCNQVEKATKMHDSLICEKKNG